MTAASSQAPTIFGVTAGDLHRLDKQEDGPLNLGQPQW